MTYKAYDAHRHHRRRIRLRGYDYSQPGAYFVTICTHNRDRMFGGIVDGQMELNRYGEMVLAHWRDLPNHHPYVELDAFVVMPNHVHGIVVIKDVRSDLEPTSARLTKRHPLSEIVRVFKTSSSRRINKMRGMAGVPVWQRSYWEHVIRNEDELSKAREYIINNPLKWELDRENPANIKTQSCIANCRGG